MRKPAAKNIPYLATLLVLGLVLIYSLYIMRSAVKAKNNSSKALRKKTAEYQNILKKSKIPPTRKSLISVTDNLEKLRERYKHLRKLLPQKKENEKSTGTS